MGYDARLSDEPLRVLNSQNGKIDPKNFNINDFKKIKSIEKDGKKIFMVPPKTSVLGLLHESFKMPDNVIATCVGKSTYARCGLFVNLTPFEPSYDGDITIEMYNSTSSALIVYPNEGIAQIMFYENSRPVSTCYKKKGGKYNGDIGIVGAKIKNEGNQK